MAITTDRVVSNAIMDWEDGWSSGSWQEITDHNRSPLEISIERIEKKQRMVNGTLRRYVVAKKRTFTCSWDMLPHNNVQAVDKPASLQTVNGHDGKWMETFHNDVDGPFRIRLRDGRGVPEIVTVMISDFSKQVQKRGLVDFWNLSVTLEEV